MRFRFIGIVLGLLLAAMVISFTRPLGSGAGSFDGRILSECDGTIRSIVIQYCAGAESTQDVYRQFLRQLPAEVKVYVLCPDANDFRDLRAAVAPVRAKLIPIPCGHPITCWSRDRWITLKGDGGDAGRVMLVCPQDEDAAAVWPQRQGDSRVAFDIADFFRFSSSSSAVRVMRSPLSFDGGDFLADCENVFVTPAVVERNMGRAVQSLDELRSTLSRRLGRNVVLLNDAPQHHAGMYMAAIGQRTMLVGDIRLGQAMQSSISPALLATLPGGADFSEATRRRFDRVADQVARLGYRVIRIPTLCAADAKTYLTYVNGIIDNQAGQKRVYMPIYQAADALNAAAAQVWRNAGYDVTPIDCTGVFRQFGTLHCLVNVLERS